MRYIRKIKTETQIRDFFESAEKRVFTFQDLTGVLTQYRDIWNLPTSTAIHKLVDRFEGNNILQKTEIIFSPEKKYTRYLYGQPTAYEVAVSLAAKSFISHFQAVFLHGLTNQSVKTVYVTHEQSPKQRAPRELTQTDIDAAFAKAQRISEVKGRYEDHTLILLNGMFTNRLGVITAPRGAGGFALTGLERTLIDITVRPSYAGGAYAVLEAYTRALEQGLSVNKLAALLQNIAFTYPYHQAVGFYLQKAGYKGPRLDLLRQKPIALDFYLDYQLANKAYNEEWRIYYPKGM